MKKESNGQYGYSPTDIAGYLESPFASWMDRFRHERRDAAPAKDPENPLAKALQERGYAHENSLEEKFRSEGRRVERVGNALNQTLDAMREGIDVILQARLARTQFGGFADFLVKVNGKSVLGDYHYEVWDTKLSRRAKPAHAVQLCCYADMLEAMQGRRPETLTLVLGDGTRERLKTQDYFHFYEAVKAAFLQAQQDFDPNVAPDPAAYHSWGDWSEYAEQLLLERDHLFQVANITRGQIKKLLRAGVSTMRGLAAVLNRRIPGLSDAAFQNLRKQAAIQIASRGHETPHYEVLVHEENEAQGLALLPPASPLDVFFDIEGFPLHDGGLEYLWGATYFDASAQRQFLDWWAHDHEQERAAFEGFIRWIYARWRKDPSMHIYHYANYEITACRKLMGRYGVCEHEVDQLLRNEVFVDLYKVVKGGILLGEPRYSIKNVEHLYRGKRETDVGTGGDSVAVYEMWQARHASGVEGDTWETSETLRSIRDYNKDDCESTHELAEWLRARQEEHGISYVGNPEVREREVREEVSARLELRDQLLVRAGELHDSSPDEARVCENLAWMLEFHRRESKPVDWRMFDRMGRSHEELMDDPDCLGNCQRTSRASFKPTETSRTVLAYEYTFDHTQECKAVAKQFSLVGAGTNDKRAPKVTFLRDHSDLKHGKIVVGSSTEPPQVVSLIPYEKVPAGQIPAAIASVAKDYMRNPSAPSAIADFLLRRPPRIRGAERGPIAAASDPNQRLRQVIAAVRGLDGSYLTIQGPPGAGKTYTGKHIIADLLQQGCKVGVASNSHKAINNLVVSAARYCQEEGIEGHFVCNSDTGPELAEAGVLIYENKELAEQVRAGCVIGTTAWGFCREEMAGQLDYLLIDEAGQVAVANLVGMSRSARNLVLMGDQMQLGQPTQGTHPAESGLSVLDYLLHGSPTIADDMGVFLGTTYRMHSQVTKFISEHVYDGRLMSDPATDHQRIAVPDGHSGDLGVEAGIVFVSVEHEGNTQASEEEVAEVVRLVGELRGREFTDKHGNKRQIDLKDILCVAPYNHQVQKLHEALGPEARVGSVDKFQGQEAPVVILSMTASDPADSPRGFDFLLDKHRLNVAVSRAQCLAVVVGNPRLATTKVATIKQMKLANLFAALQS